MTTSYPRNADDPSGHFVRSSARAHAIAGDDVHVIAPGGSAWTPPERDGPLQIHRAGGGALFTWPGALARTRQAPWRLLDGIPFTAGVLHRLRTIHPVDLAVAHWIIPSAFPLLHAIPRVPLCVHAHGADVRLLRQAPRQLREFILHLLLERGAHFVFAARALRDSLVDALPSPLASALMRAASVEPPSIEIPDVAVRAKALRDSLQLDPHQRLAVTVSRLIPSKRVDLVVEAARVSPPSLRYCIVGDGPEQGALTRTSSPSIRFLGALPRTEALSWIAAADVLLHPSTVEAAPTVIREARALGVPVVACAAGDVAAWAAHDPGIHITAPDHRAIARVLATIARRAFPE
ncbi:glycosyltransferase family 4 protein [Chondromyces crocatus]|uniref:glycosyltransferase family 4 protein n=1 Tax=Chondromyces crocatus TaxID=52 RepID=UPI001FE058EA|nr:glycosyltransferase family 4 protein [Chondromyces crocatus]